MKASGRTTSTMAKACRAMLTIFNSKVNSKRESRKELDRKDGLMAVYFSGTTSMEREMDTAYKNGPIINPTRVTTKRDSLRASARTDGLMGASSRVIGGTRKYMALAFKHTRMGAGTKAFISWTSAKATVST